MKYSVNLVRKLSNLEQKPKIEVNTKWSMVSTVIIKAKTRTDMVTIVTLMPKVLMRLESKNTLRTKCRKEYLRRLRRGRCPARRRVWR